MRLIWCIALVAFVSGCASHRNAVLPGQAVSDPSAPQGALVLEKGTGVKVTLIGGEIVAGEVIEVTESQLVVQRFGNYGVERRALSSAEILSIEVEQYSNSEETVAKTIAVLLGAAIVGIAVLAYSLRGLGELN